MSWALSLTCQLLSYAHASFYNFILNCFDEADVQCQGRITFDQFDELLSRAATSVIACEAYYFP